MADTHINLPLVETSLNDASGNSITASNPLPVSINISGTPIDPRTAYPGSVTMAAFTATNTSQTALAANASRKYLILHNPSANIMWFNFGTAAAANTPSVKLGANSTFIMEGSFVSVQAIHVIRNATVNVDFSIGEG